MIQAFLDESGTHEQAPVVGVAVFYGTQDQWAHFKELWAPSVSNIEFHALRCSRLFPALCDAIEASEVSGLLCTIGRQTYRAHAGERFKSAVGNCYALCAFVSAMSISKEVPNEPISVTLESGQPNLSFVRRVIEGMIDANEHCLAAVSVAYKRDYVELHPADFVSHVASTHDVEWMKRLMKSGRLKHGHITREVIDHTSPQVKAMFNRARNARRRQKNARKWEI